MKTSLRLLLLVAVACGAFCAARADVKLPALFSDHMVLQREVAVPVWGRADPGEEVTVAIGGQSQTAKAGADGKWKVKLEKLTGGDTLTVKGKNTITVSDVLIGEVWLCSGQSNMGFTVNRAANFEQEQAAANYPKLRMFKVAAASKETPQEECTGQWVLTTPETVGAYSATAYFFGREIHKALGVPVGLINSSWGGTSVEAWTSMEAQSKLAEFPAIIDSWKKQTAQPWDEAAAMARYEKQKAASKQNAAKARKAGKKAARAPQKPVNPRLSQNYPGNLFNGMIQPLVPFAIRGGIWYQGENNANKTFAKIYGLQLATLIQDWRARWGYEFPFAWVQLPDFHAPQKEVVEQTGWVTVREQMLKTLSVPNTGMAITLGLGMADNIHPVRKQEVGQRLALWAIAEVYKKEGVAWGGPMPAGNSVKENEIVVTFKHADGGLVAKDGELKGFAIAGADKKWVKATAKIAGKDAVAVSSPEVAKPVAVRYAWADNPEFNLYNGAGLPATPFRTDDWE